MRKRMWGLTWMAAGIAVLVFALPMGSPSLLHTGAARTADRMVLDPGHGGLDGGAVGMNGISEKDINLSIVKMIRTLAEADGWQVVLTREQDRGLYTDVIDDGTDHAQIQRRRSIRSLKTEDLKKRKSLIEQVEPTLTVSIHLNSFRADAGVHGAQSFYPEGSLDATVKADSKRLAQLIQENLVEGIADGTNRVVLGKRDMILFQDPQTPIVLVECGFLSNGEEERKLTQKKYQKKLATCIYQGIVAYRGKPVEQRNNRGDVGRVIDTEEQKEQGSI